MFILLKQSRSLNASWGFLVLLFFKAFYYFIGNTATILAAPWKTTRGMSLNPHRISIFDDSYITREMHLKNYEISDHLGNVRAVVSDLKLSTLNVSTGVPEDFEPVVATISNYYSFGMMQPGRSFGVENTRYGFNGMEKDDEIKGNGNSYDFNFRIFDSRIGKFFSVDPLASNYSSQSPYHFAGNTPIQAIDLEGLELFLVNGYDGVSNKTKDAAKSVDLAKMIKYWNNNNPSFITDVAVYFKEKDLRFLDGSQGGLSHGDVSKRYLKGYKTALKLVKNNQVDFSKDITIVGHSQGAAYSAGMAEAFLNIIEKLNTNVDEKININVNVILLAPDGAEQFTVDERANSLQLNYGDDYVVTDNKATVGNVDVDANPDRVEAFPFLTKSIKKGLKAHSAPIDSPGALKSALNKAKGLFNKKK